MATVVVPKSCKLALTSGMNAIKLHKDEQIKPKKIRQRTNLIKKRNAQAKFLMSMKKGLYPWPSDFSISRVDPKENNLILPYSFAHRYKKRNNLHKYWENKLEYVPKVELIEFILVHMWLKHNFSDEIDWNWLQYNWRLWNDLIL